MSNKTMTITDITKSSKQFKDTHTLQVGGFKDDGGRVTNKDLLVAINKLNSRIDKLEQFAEKQNQFNQFVLEQFKKHGWIN